MTGGIFIPFYKHPAHPPGCFSFARRRKTTVRHTDKNCRRDTLTDGRGDVPEEGKENDTMKRFPMNLQLFAEPGGQAGQSGTGDGGSAGAAGSGAGSGAAAGGTAGQSGGTQPQFDYEKLASLIAGKTSVTEDTVLKSYFRQQGLSQEEMAQAIQAFKAQKAASQPDVGALQAQAAQAQAAARQAQVENAAILAAVGLGVDTKTIPYLIKMTDLSLAVGQDGNVNAEAVTNALKQTLEDVPGLKPQAAGQTGFVQVGAAGNSPQQAQQTAHTPPAAVPAKRWNRFNN